MQLQKLASLENTRFAPSPSRHACLLCDLARQHEEAGDLEAARVALGKFWERIGDRPRLDGLDEEARAEVLLRAGTLSGRIGSARQISGAQEIAKDLITESGLVFEKLGLRERVAEAQIDLAVCYWREGALDEARVILTEISGQLSDGKGEQRLRALANLAILERSAKRYKVALQIQTEAAPLFEGSSNHALRGSFHNEYATVLKHLGLAELRGDYIDRAFIEYAAASYHLEQAGHTRHLARLQNNLGLLFLTSGRFVEAHQHLNRARSVFVSLKDKGSVAQVDESRARVFLAEGRNLEAERVVRGSVRTLGEGDESSLFSEALTTLGTAQARLGNHQQAYRTLKRASDMAQALGDPESAGTAALTIAEELGKHVPPNESLERYRSAEALLAHSQQPGIQIRLGECARRLLSAEEFLKPDDRLTTRPDSNGNGSRHLQGPIENLISKDFSICSLEQEVLRYESHLIRRALQAVGGKVTRAARLLGLTHQGLAFILNGRQKELLSARTPVRRRRRSMIRHR